MTFRRLLASHEERAFSDEINRQVGTLGASVHVFEQVDTANNERRFGIVFSCGSQRITLYSESPWHIEPVGSVIGELRQWLAAAAVPESWSTEPPDDVRRELAQQD